MIKKVNVSQLKPGMYIHDFDCGWMEIPFMRRSLAVKDEGVIQAIVKHGIKAVYIDTERGLDISEAPTREEVAATMQAAVEKIAGNAVIPISTRSFPEEIARAKKIRTEAEQTVATFMTSAQQGGKIDFAMVDDTVGKMTESVFDNMDAMLCLSRLRTRDQYTFQHSVNVCVYMLAFCRAMGMNREESSVIGVGALLHDVGKMRVPDAILNKPAKLDDAEFEQMRMHVSHSFQILKGEMDIPDNVIAVAFEHHERFDGTGYPLRLKGEEISMAGQMAAIVDVYDAITSDRCYHNGIDPTQALRKLYEWSESHFNRDLVQQYIKCMGVYPLGTMVRLESGYLAVVVGAGEKSALKPTVRVVYDTRKNKAVPSPHDLRLSDAAVADKIVAYEHAQKWGINPMQYLEMA